MCIRDRKKVKEGVEVTLTQPRTYLEIQLNSEEITKNKQLNNSKRKASKPCTHGRTSFNTTWPHLHNRKQDIGDRPTNNQLVGKTHQRKTQQQPKTKDIHRAKINHSPRSVRSGDQGDCTTKSHRYSTTEVHTINPGETIPKWKQRRKPQKEC